MMKLENMLLCNTSRMSCLSSECCRLLRLAATAVELCVDEWKMVADKVTFSRDVYAISCTSIFPCVNHQTRIMMRSKVRLNLQRCRWLCVDQARSMMRWCEAAPRRSAASHTFARAIQSHSREFAGDRLLFGRCGPGAASVLTVSLANSGPQIQVWEFVRKPDAPRKVTRSISLSSGSHGPGAYRTR